MDANALVLVIKVRRWGIIPNLIETVTPERQHVPKLFNPLLKFSPKGRPPRTRLWAAGMTFEIFFSETGAGKHVSGEVGCSWSFIFVFQLVNGVIGPLCA